MAGRLTTLVGVLLSLLIAVGTWLYVAGIAPPFPANAWAFNGVLCIATLYALALGRTPRR